MSKSIRNLVIFSAVTVSCGWIGAWINTQIPSPSPQQSLGLLFWLAAPLATVLLLRGFGGDGWADFGLRLNLGRNLGWYALAVLIYPMTIFISLGLAVLLGAASIERSLSELPSIILIGITGSLIKNIFEEFAWRGYLTPRFKAAGLGSFANHMLTGLIWGVWHIPYWIFFLGSGVIDEYSSIGMTGFMLLALIGIFPASLVLGELRLKTGSVWSPYIAHILTNALSTPLILEGFFKFKPGMDLIFSSNTDGFIMFVLFWGIGLWMRRKKE